MFQIPEPHKSFKLKTLCIALTEASAKPYTFFERNVVELPAIENPEIQHQYSDKEGFSVSPTGMGTAMGTESHSREHYEKTYLNFFVKELAKLDQKEKYDQMIFFVPQKMSKDLHEKLSKELQQKAQYIMGNFYKMQPIDLLKKIEKEEKEAWEKGSE